MLEQQNQRHQEFMRKQHEMFLMKVDSHKQAIDNKFEQKSSSFQDKFNWNRENYANQNNADNNEFSDNSNIRHYSQSIVIETK